MKKVIGWGLGLILGLAVVAAQADEFNWNSQLSGFPGPLYARASTHSSVRSDSAESTDDSYSVSGDRWVRFYTGYDFAFLDDVVNGMNGYSNYDRSVNDTDIGSSGHRDGYLFGVELGQQLDEDDSLSLSGELVLTQPSQSFSNSGVASYGLVTLGPSLLSLSVNYERTLLRGKGLRTFVSVGGGYYHAMLHVSGDNTGSVDLDYDTVMTGDILGGTLAVGQELVVNSWLSLDLTGRFRAANFSQVSGQVVNVTGTYNSDFGTSGPYTVFVLPSQQNILVVGPTSLIGTPGARPMALDYSGLDGLLTVKMSF